MGDDADLAWAAAASRAAASAAASEGEEGVGETVAEACTDVAATAVGSAAAEEDEEAVTSATRGATEALAAAAALAIVWNIACVEGIGAMRWSASTSVANLSGPSLVKSCAWAEVDKQTLNGGSTTHLERVAR